MYGVETIHSLNAKAVEADYIIRKHQYLDTLTEDQKFAFNQLAPDMQRLIVNQNITNRKEQPLEKR